jgi:hypothetical protein
MDLKELILRIKGDPKGAVSALDSVQQATHKFGSIVKTIIAGAAVAAVVSFGKACINAAGEAQQGEVLLRASLGNVKGMTDAAKDSAVAWVNEMEASKSFDDAEISAALQRVIVKTGDLTKSQEYVSIAMEVARNKGIDLSSATTLLEQAYNGSARGLKQFGVEVKEGATGMDYLHAIQVKVKGSGDAWSQTLEGQRTAFKTTFGNFQESVGGVLMPLATKFMDVLMPYLKQAMSWITDHMPQIQQVITSVVQGIGKAFEIGSKVINGVVDTIKWIIDHAKQAIDWVKGVQGASDAALGSKGDILSGGRYASGMVSPVPHASGGWVGLHGPEIALVGEKGPEYITPAGQTGGNDLLLRGIADRLDTLIRVSAGIPSGVGNALNGLGR